MILRIFIVILFIKLVSSSLEDNSFKNVLKNFELIPSLKIKTRNTRSTEKSQTLDLFVFERHFISNLRVDKSLFTSDFRVVEIDEDNHQHERNVDVSVFTGTVYDQVSDNDNMDPHYNKGEGVVRVIAKGSDIMRLLIELETENIIVEAVNNTNMVAYKDSDIISPNDHGNIQGYSYNANPDEDSYTNRTSRTKRGTSQCPRPQYRYCPVLLVADYQFYQNILGGGNIVYTTSYLVSLMDDINRIYKQHSFSECGSGFGFKIKDIRIHSAISRLVNHYNIEKVLSPEDILMRFGSKYNTQDLTKFCLGHLFVARPLKSNSSNVLGISNLAGALLRKGLVSSGGICSINPVTENGFSYQVNTGMTSFLNSNGKRVLSRQATLVLAHEFGHNWGSHHDPELSAECGPNHNYPGNYIMYPFSVTGIEPNNKKFSNCSLREIKEVLKAKAEKCFVGESTKETLCGNYRVEENEMCDVGLSDSDKCCRQCKFLPGASCSDRNERCCSQCQLANSSMICMLESVCALAVYCSGVDTSCPDPTPKDDGQKCQTNRGTEGKCMNGSCLDGCEYIGLTDCICDGDLSCTVCCRNASDLKCQPFLNSESKTEAWPDQSPCSIGFCLNGTCIKSISQPLQRIWSLIEIKDIHSLKRFIENNVVGTVIVLSLLIWIPASCVVSHIDRKRLKLELEQLENENFNFQDFEINDRKIKYSKKINDN